MPSHSRLVFALALGSLLAIEPPLHAAEHPCARDAIQHAKKLLRFHIDDPSEDRIGDGDKVVQRAPVRTINGKRLDVLEVTSNIYKATYRMRFVYLRGPGDCALAGQEIVEVGLRP